MTTNTNENTNTNLDTEVETNEQTNVNNDEQLTMDKVEKMIQSATDKVRTEYNKKLKLKEKEMEEFKKSSMTEQQQIDYEKQKLEDELSKREQALLEKEEVFKRSQLENETLKLLQTENLPLEAQAFLIGTNIDTTTDNIKAFKVMFDNAIESVVSERIKNTSKEHKQSSSSTISKAEFKNMGWKERNELFNSNPQLYKELSK